MLYTWSASQASRYWRFERDIDCLTATNRNCAVWTAVPAVIRVAQIGTRIQKGVHELLFSG